MSQGRQCWAAAAGGCGGLVTKTLNIETCGERPAAGLPSDNPSGLWRISAPMSSFQI